MTSPSCPVTFRVPPPLGLPSSFNPRTIPMVSMYNALPPMEVYANPITIPWGNGSLSYSRSLVKIGLPTYSFRLSSVTVQDFDFRRLFSVSSAPSSSATIWSANFLVILSMCLLKFRTPASLQYQRARLSIASFEIPTVSGTLSAWTYASKGVRLSSFSSPLLSSVSGVVSGPSSASPFFPSSFSTINPLSFIDLGTRYCSAMATFSGKS
mmetsp:Transcript_116978/g.174717  ORF Transcript_116978/g.174717 Transcript_116978/m.174717 type:complete len:210 (+) Transcript_116978:573-1202(+)